MLVKFRRVRKNKENGEHLVEVHDVQCQYFIGDNVKCLSERNSNGF